MLSTRHLNLSEYRLKTWKNGQGRTLEIAKDEATPFRWRLSSATVAQSCAFSVYEGYERVLVLLEGGPVQIEHENRKPKPLVAPGPSQVFRCRKDACSGSGSGSGL